MRPPKPTPGVQMLLATLVPGVLAAAFFLHAALPDTVELEWRFVAGEPFFEETETSTRARGSEQLSKRTYVFRWLPISENEFGDWTIERRLERIKVESENAGANIVVYDSANPDGNSAVFERVYDGLVGWQSAVVLSPKYEVANLILPRAPQPNSPAADVADFHNHETHREMIESLLVWTRPRRVRGGDSWAVDRFPQALVATGFEAHTFRHDGRDGALDRLRADIAVRQFVSKNGAPVAVRGNGAVLQQHKGIATFDRDRGRFSRLELYLDVKGNFMMLAGGGAEGVYQTRRITRITDALPE